MYMDIKHLEYFTEIVNCDFNLSSASKKLNISQPALSSIIKNFEIENSMALFERYKGRLVNLTPAGEVFHNNALELLEQYNKMMTEVRESSLKLKGKVRIGIPPLILSVTFSKVMPKLILENPDIKFEIIELGAHQLRTKILSRELDFAILLQPTEISANINEHLLAQSQLSAFMNTSHPLARKKALTWQEMSSVPLAMFDTSFMIYHQIISKFKEHNLQPNIALMSQSWDFLLLSVQNTALATILPAPVGELFNLQDIIQVPFVDPIPWKVSICHQKKSRYSSLETHVLNSIIKNI